MNFVELTSWKNYLEGFQSPQIPVYANPTLNMMFGAIPGFVICVRLDNSGSDSRNLIGQLQVSKLGRNLERDSST